MLLAPFQFTKILGLHFSADEGQLRLLEPMTQTPMFASSLGLISHDVSSIRHPPLSPDLFLEENKRSRPQLPVVSAAWIMN